MTGLFIIIKFTANFKYSRLYHHIMPKKIQFFPIDITYKVINEKPVIYLFGRTSKGEHITVIDSTLEPYFYVIPKKGEKLNDKIEKIKVEVKDKTAIVTKTENIKKSYMGREVNVIKVYTRLPRDVPVIRNVVKDWDMVESTNEYDIHFVRRYLVDKGITPMTLVEAEGDFVKQKIKTNVFEAKKIKQFSDATLTAPKILAFDIETYNPSGKSINFEKNPIIMLSFYGNKFKKVITWKRFKTKEDYIEFVESEAELIEKFKETIEHFRPDIIAGYFSDEFDLPYIQKRAEKYKIKLDIGLDYSELSVKKTRNVVSKITGVIHLDVYKAIKKLISSKLSTQFYDLGSVSSELLNKKKIDIDLENLADVWDKHKEKLEPYCKYNLHDSILAFKLCEKIMPNIIEMVKIIGLPVFEINRMGFSQLVEWYLIKQAPNFNEIIPNKPHYGEVGQRRLKTYKGAFVYEPKPGLYKDIAIFDFRSLYPTIISSHNISPGMLNCECCKNTAEKAPGEKYWFCKKRKGFLPTVIGDLIKHRMRIKEMMKQSKNVLLDARQHSLKILANAFYGYFGFFGARWYSIECAESTTAWGRYHIYNVIDKAKKEEFNVIYGDTDSIFISLEGKTKQDAKQFTESINQELPGIMEIEYEGYYSAALFVSAKAGEHGAKKKYALLAEDGTIKITGFETVRRNWSLIAKEVQEKVLGIVLKENKPEKALKYVKDIINKLKDKKIGLEKVIIHTRLQKELSSYTAVGPHVAIAKKLEKKGFDIFQGMVIEYVVTEGANRIRDRAKLPDEVTQKDYDSDYYINHQVIPAVERIFDVLGYSKTDLLESKAQSKLGKFI